MSKEMMQKEIREAVAAGENALASLREAQNSLNSARSWGIFDLLGGGFIADMAKHTKIRDASFYMEQAQSDLQAFQRELKDVQVPTELRIEIGGFLSFADFFLDGFVTDYMVQTKIADARTQVADAILRVENILAELKRID